MNDWQTFDKSLYSHKAVILLLDYIQMGSFRGGKTPLMSFLA
ncbi:MAG: hypothetical protein VKL59_06500 [Nostocaceae cyanobacterium]|nr:hypothetical protein [Nostocaceae cyanobacterium]